MTSEQNADLGPVDTKPMADDVNVIEAECYECGNERSAFWLRLTDAEGTILDGESVCSGCVRKVARRVGLVAGR